MSGSADNACPRCGGAFHCGANDAEPCACTALQLDDTTLSGLRQRYVGGLCLACLRELAAGGRAATTIGDRT